MKKKLVTMCLVALVTSALLLQGCGIGLGVGRGLGEVCYGVGDTFHPGVMISSSGRPGSQALIPLQQQPPAVQPVYVPPPNQQCAPPSAPTYVVGLQPAPRQVFGGQNNQVVDMSVPINQLAEDRNPENVILDNKSNYMIVCQNSLGQRKEVGPKSAVGWYVPEGTAFACHVKLYMKDDDRWIQVGGTWRQSFMVSYPRTITVSPNGLTQDGTQVDCTVR